MPSIQRSLVRLAVAAVVLTILGALAIVPTVWAAPGAAADPTTGPHERADLVHKHDTLAFTRASSPIVPRRNAPQSGAASVAGPATPASPFSTIPNGGALRREVLGYAPYYELSQNANWNYSLLSTVAYFGLDVRGDGSFDMSTPGGQGWGSQQLTTIINSAHQAGDRVVVVLKGAQGAAGINALVTNPAARQTAITNTIDAIAAKRLDGVNVDLEGTSSGYPNVQTGFTAFIRELSQAVHQRWPAAYVTVATYSGSASWDGGIFKIGDLAPLVDGLFIMAYDSSFSNMPGQAGPNAPLSGPWSYTDSNAVNQYLSKAPASKLLLGVPYYGYKWSTTSNQPYAAIAANTGAQADTYSGVLDDFSCGAQQLSKNWDAPSSTPWASWFSPGSGDPCGGNHNSTRELYYDNAQSLGLKYDLVNSAGLQGTGMWALGYDGSSPDLWNVLQAKFTGPSTTFYFAEGYTGSGFSETLSLLMPGYTGVAYIDYYTESGHLPTFGILVSAGKVTVVNVNQYVGAGHQVSALVTLPAQGVAERTMRFNNGAWHGSTAVVGINHPATEWDFAEGSTLSIFSEYVTMQNPSNTPAPVTLNYVTDSPAHATKTLTLPANSRTTVAVFNGDLSSPTVACTASGTGANCGVGPGMAGVSLQVLSPSVPIVVERPMYVNTFNFGDGAIRDGHVDFGVNAPGTVWNFAEGTTIKGFKEYLTLQNPGTVQASVNLKYVDTSSTVTNRPLTLAPQSRSTVEVFNPLHGVGPGVGGVSVQVTSDQPVVAERPMYMAFNFGSGVVAGAHVVAGASSGASLFEFSNASTASGENDYLSVLNLEASTANLAISYYGPSGRVVRNVSVGSNSRHTVEVFNTAEGIGRAFSPLGITVVSDRPVLVEQPTYNALSATYGATDTLGYSPA